eukprot:scaffold34504_cov36-Tisochrysis_lutea.AAC.3
MINSLECVPCAPTSPLVILRHHAQWPHDLCQVIPAVAAMPEPMLQWPQLVAFAQEFEICPALLSWSKLSRMVCFTGSCAISHRWQAPESHGITRECVPQHIIPSTALPTAVAMVVP